MKNKLLVSQISGLYLGSETQFTAEIASGINHKKPARKLEVQSDILVGDGQADARHHGGEDRVLHHFPREHYAQYRRRELMSDLKDAPAMGENISTLGLDETRVYIGDIIRIGAVELQVTQPRSPCFKLNLQFGHKEFALAMQTSGLCGWFYRVLQAGTINISDDVILCQRRTDISVAEAMRIYFAPEFDAEQYERLAGCEGLAATWVKSLHRRLEHQVVEDWQLRLYGARWGKT